MERLGGAKRPVECTEVTVKGERYVEDAREGISKDTAKTS